MHRSGLIALTVVVAFVSAGSAEAHAAAPALRLSASPKTLTVGEPTRVTFIARLGGQRAPGVTITALGRRARSDRRGRAQLQLLPTAPGRVLVRGIGRCGRRRCASAPLALRVQKRLIILNDDVAMYRESSDTEPYANPALTLGLPNYTAGGDPFADPEFLRGGLPFPFSEPEGGYEVTALLRDPRFHVLGITTQYGIISGRGAYDSVHRIESIVRQQDPRAQTGVPVLRGADTAADLGHPTDASRFIAHQVTSHCGRVEIIDTAPMTNVATAMMLEPRLTRCWKALWSATGDFNGHLGKPSDLDSLGITEFNTNADLPATRYVLAHGGGFSILPNELMDDSRLDTAHFGKIATAGSPIGDYVAYQSAEYNASFAASGGIALHGPVAMLTALDPSYVAGVPVVRSGVELTFVDAKPYRGWLYTLSRRPGLPIHTIYPALGAGQGTRVEDYMTNALK